MLLFRRRKATQKYLEQVSWEAEQSLAEAKVARREQEQKLMQEQETVRARLTTIKERNDLSSIIAGLFANGGNHA